MVYEEGGGGGVNRGVEILRSVLFFGTNPHPHYVKSYCGIRLLQRRVDVCLFFSA